MKGSILHVWRWWKPVAVNSRLPERADSVFSIPHFLLFTFNILSTDQQYLGPIGSVQVVQQFEFRKGTRTTEKFPRRGFCWIPHSSTELGSALLSGHISK